MSKLGISGRTSLDLDPPRRSLGLRREPARDAERPGAPGVPRVGTGSARRRAPAGQRRRCPPTPAGAARAARRGPGRAAGGGEGGRERPAAGRARGEARGRGARLPLRRPNKDARGSPARPCLAGWERGRRRRQVRSSGRSGGAIMGGAGEPVRPRGKNPLPAAAPRPPQHRRRGRCKPRAPRGGRGRGRGESWVRVCFILPGWRCAFPRGRTSGRASGVPRPRSGRPGAAQRCARRVLARASARLSRSASASSARPLAPGARIDLVALASGSRGSPASTPRLPIPAHSPARPLAHSLARAPARRRRRATRDPLQIPGPANASAPQPGPGSARGSEPSLLPTRRRQPHAPFILRRKTTRRVLTFLPSSSFSQGSADSVHYLRVKFSVHAVFILRNVEQHVHRTHRTVL